MGNFTNCESIFQHNKKLFLMPPRETSDHYLLYPDELLNRRSELVTKCRHENTVLSKTLIVKTEVPLYEILLTHISEIPSISI